MIPRRDPPRCSYTYSHKSVSPPTGGKSETLKVFFFAVFCFSFLLVVLGFLFYGLFLLFRAFFLQQWDTTRLVGILRRNIIRNIRRKATRRLGQRTWTRETRGVLFIYLIFFSPFSSSPRCCSTLPHSPPLHRSPLPIEAIAKKSSWGEWELRWRE